MSEELPLKADEIDSPVVEDNQPDNSNPTTDYQWTARSERCLLEGVVSFKPAGINKHFSMLLIRKYLYEAHDLDIPTECIWKYLASKWDIEAADNIEFSTLDRSKTDFVLPEEFDELIAEEGEKIKKQETESLNEEINKKILSNLSGKTRTKSNSMSSAESKEGFNDMVPSTLLENSSIKTTEVVSEDGPCTRRSLRTNNKQEISSSDEKSKLKDLKQLTKPISNQSQDMKKTEKYSNSSLRKRKTRNLSESCFSSDNSKPRRNYKNNASDINISDSSSRSVTPEILRGKTSNRSVTPEIISRKSNLRSSDKDQKSKLALEIASLKVGHHNDPVLPEIKTDRLESEKQSETSLESKSKTLTPNKNEVNNKVKAKIRNRVTSDLLVVQQSPDIQPLGRRSCSNKNLKTTNE